MPDERSYMESRDPCQQHHRFDAAMSEDWLSNADLRPLASA